MACFDESASLPGTSTGVRPVYESALVVHEVAEIPGGTGQSLAKVIGGALQYLGGDRVAHTEDFAEDVAQTLFAIDRKADGEQRAQEW